MSKATRFLLVLGLCASVTGLSWAQEPIKALPAELDSPEQCGAIVGGVFDANDVPGQPTAQGITFPTVVPASKVAPAYPEVARKAGTQGKVRLQAVVCQDGSVQGIHVLKSPSPELGQAAVDAVRNWKFKPALKEGKPVAVRYRVSVEVKPDVKP